MAKYIEGHKFIPEYPYFAFINCKMGDLDLSPIPPQHIQSLTIEKSINNVIPGGTLTVFDETAILIEYAINGIGLSVNATVDTSGNSSNSGNNNSSSTQNKNLTLEWGYVNGPTSGKYVYTLKEYTTSFTNDGSMTLTIEFVCFHPPERQQTKAYLDENGDGMRIEAILHELAQEAGWRITEDSIEPIEDVTVDIMSINQDTYNTEESKELKKFLRFNKTPIKFILEDLAPYCISKEGHLSGYTLWFDNPESAERPNFSEAVTIDNFGEALGNALEQAGKDLLYQLDLLHLDEKKITNTLLTKLIREAAANTVIEGVIETIEAINASGGLGGFLTNMVMSAISNYLNSVVSNFASQLTSALTSGINSAIGGSIGNALSGMVTNLITSAINNLINSVFGSIIDTLKGHLSESIDADKLDELAIRNEGPGSLSIGTDELDRNSVLSVGGCFEDVSQKFTEAFQSAAMQFADQMTRAVDGVVESALSEVVGGLAESEAERKNSNMPIMYFKPYMKWKNDHTDGEDFTENIPDMYRFEYGVGRDSNVIEVSINYKGSMLAAAANSVSTSVIDRATGLLQRAGYDRSTNLYGLEYDSVEDPINRSVLRLPFSSTGEHSGLDEINNKAAFLWAKGRSAAQTEGSITIIGDPRLEVKKVCSILIYTKFGQVFHRSGTYMITKISENIQGGLYTTTLTVVGSNVKANDKGEAGSLDSNSNLTGGSNNQTLHQLGEDAKAKSADPTATDNESRSNSSGNIDGAVSYCLSKTTNTTSDDNFTNVSFVAKALQDGGGFAIYTDKPPENCDSLKMKLKEAKFNAINYPGNDKTNQLQRGDILFNNQGQCGLYVGNVKNSNMSWNTVMRVGGSVANVSTPNTLAETFRATSYAPSKAGDAMEGGYDVGWGMQNFFEGKTQANHYLAADTNILPYGTVVYVTFPSPYGNFTGEYLVVDCGSGISGKHIDVYVGNQENGANPNVFNINVELQKTGKSISKSEATKWKPGYNG